MTRTSGTDSLAAGLGEVAYRRDRVYVTSRRDLAEVWAGMWTNPRTGARGRGVLYSVEVELNALEPDADLLSLPGLSFQTDQATVRGIERTIAYDPTRFASILQQVLTDLERAKRR